MTLQEEIDKILKGLIPKEKRLSDLSQTRTIRHSGQVVTIGNFQDISKLQREIQTDKETIRIFTLQRDAQEPNDLSPLQKQIFDLELKANSIFQGFTGTNSAARRDADNRAQQRADIITQVNILKEKLRIQELTPMPKEEKQNLGDPIKEPQIISNSNVSLAVPLAIAAAFIL